MAEEIRDLIEKIQEDGIRAAEEKARQIEAAAQLRADEILDRAQKEAEAMLSAARERIRRDEANEKAMLAQAGRDLLLSLRNEITAMLGRLLEGEVRGALSPDVLSTLLSDVIRRGGTGGGGDVTVFLKGEDLERMEGHFLQRLREETKRQIVLLPAEGISGGFLISWDGGKSCFDYSDRALAAYLGARLKPELDRILRDAARD
jgi:V/A-type H+/Na+-transporting ATPase subunit E